MFFFTMCSTSGGGKVVNNDGWVDKKKTPENTLDRFKCSTRVLLKFLKPIQ